MKPSEIIQAVVSALLALIGVLGAFAIVFYQIVNGHEVKLPDFVGLLIGGIIGSYLTHVASVNGARQAGTAAAQTAYDQVVVNAQEASRVGSVPPTP
jgi:Na+/glutamate symporter